MEKKNDEIDLLELFLRGVNIIRANFWLILTFFLLGATLGLTSFFTSRKVWENKMVISSGILTKTYAELLINKVDRYLGENNINAVNQALKLSPEAIKGIHRLRVEGLTDVDDTKESDRFIITAETYNQEILPELQKNLIDYLENNEFVKIRVDQNKNYFSEMIREVDTEIKDMEAWKQKIVSGSFFQNVEGNFMFDPTTINSKILELKKEKINLQNSLALANSVQMIEPFSAFQNPSKPRLSISLAFGSFIGLVFVGLLIAFKSLRKILRMADIAKQNA